MRWLDAIRQIGLTAQTHSRWKKNGGTAATQLKELKPVPEAIGQMRQRPITRLHAHRTNRVGLNNTDRKLKSLA
ncbi:hypothetical protein [uncultured Pelagimonas sp.]|uniref:hypothetical protein n=1 Tax=uncultured Pelagimonas sp. TaxID=1618102 RepID=UPI00262E7B7E|nr:hypothetical protein [uncultured Pelagimonas sp.]